VAGQQNAPKVALDCPICIALYSDFRNMVSRKMGANMSAQLRSISTITCASVFLGLGLGVGVPVKIALAFDCLTAPNSPAPRNGHWFYRIDRTQERTCWHLQTDNDQSEGATAQTAREAPAKTSQSIAKGGSYAVAGSNGATKLSGEDVEELYTAFLEWRRRTKK
jgi:hypothetical protein